MHAKTSIFGATPRAFGHAGFCVHQRVPLRFRKHVPCTGEFMKIARWLAVLSILTAFAAAQTTIAERLRVDASDAPRNILHSTLTVPVASGAVTLVYPKWIPGNHRPTGPIQNLTGLHIKAGAQELDWQRDLVDMWAFHLQVPEGVRELQVSFDTLTYNGKSSAASSKVLDLLWNQVVLYPQNTATDSVEVTASIRLPEGWKSGSALATTGRSESSGSSESLGSSTQFHPDSLTRLVDSPLIAGRWYRQVHPSPPPRRPPTLVVPGGG